jgi:D-beta-D-heptose 7-phosphate kinase/D-beta-D-heptose 1-phosphate adenosyltransferase
MNILVIGDSCEDVFVYCDALKFAPDFPVPVLTVKHQTKNPGMASNVYRNISAMIDGCWIITNSDWEQITKTRYVHESTNHMFMRVDSGKSRYRFNHTIDYKEIDIVVISDYDKGFLSCKDIDHICSSHPKVFLDTKKKLDSWADNAFIIKINDIEYNSSTYTNVLAEKIIHTMGAKGAKYRDVIYPTNKSEVQDLSGAGDSFLAGLVVEYAKSQNMFNAINFANECASEAVRHRGVFSV